MLLLVPPLLMGVVQREDGSGRWLTALAVGPTPEGIPAVLQCCGVVLQCWKGYCGVAEGAAPGVRPGERKDMVPKEEDAAEGVLLLVTQEACPLPECEDSCVDNDAEAEAVVSGAGVDSATSVGSGSTDSDATAKAAADSGLAAADVVALPPAAPVWGVGRLGTGCSSCVRACVCACAASLASWIRHCCRRLRRTCTWRRGRREQSSMSVTLHQLSPVSSQV